MKLSRYALTVVILFLFITTVNANKPAYLFKNIFSFHKRDDQSRLLLIAVLDTNDETIGKRCDEDLNNIDYTFTELADWMDVDIESKIIKGDDFSKTSVNDAIDNWLTSEQPTTDDIVVFYYSGHGFRDSTDGSKYPRMWLKTSDDKDVETNNLQLEEVYNRIVKTGAGVNLVLADCCNTTNAGDNANFDNIQVPARKRVAHKRVHNTDSSDDDDGLDNAEKIFTPGQSFSIIANAAEKGEFAAGKEDVGGFFTYLLYRSFREVRL